MLSAAQTFERCSLRAVSAFTVLSATVENLEGTITVSHSECCSKS